MRQSACSTAVDPYIKPQRQLAEQRIALQASTIDDDGQPRPDAGAYQHTHTTQPAAHASSSRYVWAACHLPPSMTQHTNSAAAKLQTHCLHVQLPDHAVDRTMIGSLMPRCCLPTRPCDGRSSLRGGKNEWATHRREPRTISPIVHLTCPDTRQKHCVARVAAQLLLWLADRKIMAHAPSVSRALPPVGVHSTAEQPPHSTTVWEWEKTVVLRVTGARAQVWSRAVHGHAVRAAASARCSTHIWKQPWHLTSMKKLLGVCGQGAGSGEAGSP